VDGAPPDAAPDTAAPDQSPPADSSSPDATKVSCKPMDAKGEGLCEKHMGYAWDGKVCKGVSGCKCVGKDCTKLFFNKQDCVKAHAHCP